MMPLHFKFVFEVMTAGQITSSVLVNGEKAGRLILDPAHYRVFRTMLLLGEEELNHPSVTIDIEPLEGGLRCLACSTTKLE
jgi:hypothetical protein